jgi:hypothetical protein
LRPAYLWRQIPTAAFVLTIVIASGSSAFSIAFYSVSAEVIPVLVLVLAVELRVFATPDMVRRVQSAGLRRDPGELLELIEADEWRGSVWLGLIVVLMAMIAGEIIALVAVATQEPAGTIGQGVVLGSIVAGFAKVALEAISSLSDREVGGPPPRLR